MVFSSFSFLFLFFPAVCLGYALTPDRLKNLFLFLASLVFYAWGEPAFVFIMLASILINYSAGRLIGRLRIPQPAKARAAVATAIGLNLLLLCFFKYAAFLLRTLLEGLALFGSSPEMTVPEIPLPIGISFFTFQGLSYIVDVYRGEVSAQRNLISLGLYIALFPQLIAGPIVRYQSIEKEISERAVTLEGVTAGLRLFSYGLAKKILIANNMGAVADAVFSLPAGSTSLPLSWLGVAAYTLQIYFDFSGYSDMAIGLGQIFGFHFPENFRYPYIARSMTEFWRRWHISLSSWFKDYLYIPLGGNRKGTAATYRNLGIVFCATGIWHGADWTFLVWGLWHGAFLVVERIMPRFFAALPRVLQHVYVLLAVMTGWVFFRSDTIRDAWEYLGGMFSLSRLAPEARFYELANMHTLVFFGLGCVLAAPFFRYCLRCLPASCVYENILSLFIMGTAITFSMNTTYNPFLYFRF